MSSCRVTNAKPSVVVDGPIDFALARIAEHRRRLIGSEAEVRAVYAECRSYAVDVVNAIFRAEPALAEELGMLGKEGA